MIESHQVTARPKPVVITVSSTVVHSTMNTAPKTMYKQYIQLTHRVVCIPCVVLYQCSDLAHVPPAPVVIQTRPERRPAADIKSEVSISGFIPNFLQDLSSTSPLPCLLKPCSQYELFHCPLGSGNTPCTSVLHLALFINTWLLHLHLATLT